LSLAHVTALYFDDRSEAAKKRVQRLKAAGLVAGRPRAVFEPSVLGLTPRGLRLLAGEGHLQDRHGSSLRHLEKHLRVSDATLAHELQVADVKMVFVRAVAQTPSLSILDFTSWPVLYEFCAATADGKQISLRPDGFLRLAEDGPSGTRRIHALFVEVDRSTETLETLTGKAQGYRDYYRSGGFATRCGASRNHYRAHPFRVLIVCRNGERRDHILDRLLSLDPPIRSLVWCTTRDELLREPLGAIWRCPKHSDALPLLGEGQRSGATADDHPCTDSHPDMLKSASSSSAPRQR
jgi:hypothetical protein